MTSYDVVIPTAGRPTLARLLAALAAGGGPLPRRVLVVDDRRAPARALALDPPAALAPRVAVLRSGGRGPAAARNAGWRASEAAWVAFLDDDVVPVAGWREALARDLAGPAPRVAASQGALSVPLASGRRATDWERDVAGLERASWITADMAFRRAALAALGGFDERFPRAYREDADIALRLHARGWAVAVGSRRVLHPVADADDWVSVRRQAGNADDALMRALHGRDWRARARAAPGRLPAHAATALAGLAAVALAPRRPALAAVAAAAWALATAELAWRRIRPGPRTPAELRRMLLSSVALPFAAGWHRGRGELRARHVARRGAGPAPERPLAVLLDRDGTLVEDVPYNGDPARVRPLPGVRDGLDALRAAGIRLAVVSNQSGVARGLISAAQVDAVNARVAELLGPFDLILTCPHGPGDGCDCRKPRPGLLVEAAARLGVAPARCAMIGDIGADVAAASAAGARPLLVPTSRTRAAEIAAAPEVVGSFAAAVALLLLGRAPGVGAGVARTWRAAA